MKLVITLLALTLTASPAFAQKAAEAKNAVQLGAFSTAIENIGEPQDPEEYYWLGRAQIGLGQVDQAEATFNAILEMNPENSMGHDGLAHIYNVRKQYEMALESATKAIELDGGNAEAYYAQGVAYAYSQNLPKAQSSLAKAVQMNPSNPYAHYHLGLIYNRLDRFDQTVIHFTRFLQLLPVAPEAAQVKAILRTVSRR